MKPIRIVRELAVNSTDGLNLARLCKEKGVDLAEVIEYRLCEYMGRCGYAYQYIADETGLTKGQVAARLKSGQIKVKDYRNGNSPLAKAIVGKLSAVAKQRYIANMQRYLLHQ